MNVLLLTDFSVASDNAARYAIDYFRHLPVKFYLLNIQNFHLDEQQVDTTLELKLTGTLDRLVKKQNYLKEYSSDKNHDFYTILSSENLIIATRNAIEEKKIDYVVIGAVSQSEKHHPILGDHAYEVVRKIRSKIIAVPSNSVYRYPEKVIFPVDFSVSGKERVNDLLNHRSFLKQADFSIFEIERKEDWQETVENDLQNFIRTAKAYSGNDTEDTVTTKTGILDDIQKKFDMIFILGKNLYVCDRLLHNTHGISAQMKLSIPIFVYHE